MSKINFIRPIGATLYRRLLEPRQFIQVLTGARQVGKTTLAGQVANWSGIPYFFANADQPTLQSSEWLESQWEQARLKAKKSKSPKGFVLILDEIQKVPRWSHIVKHLWDQDTRTKTPLKVLLLGSAPLLINQGLTESLAGRFEILHLPHWSFLEMKKAFNYTLDKYIFYGGYPGSANLIKNPNRWANYIRQSLIETTLSRDILLLSPVNKPALLRRLFELGCYYSGQILSYNKMLGHLQDAGNTTTLAHYLTLLEGAGMMCGLQKYSKTFLGKRNSIPKLQVLNTALMTSSLQLSMAQAHANKTVWGRIVESAVGAHLINTSVNTGCKVFYWRESNQEVDFILQYKNNITAIEVKTGNTRLGRLSGLKVFAKLFPSTKKKLILGKEGISFKDFFSLPADKWVN